MTLEEVILRHACGMPLEDPRLAPGGAGVLMLPVPGAGILGSVSGVKESSELSGVTGVEVTIPPGQAVEPLPEGDRYLGFVIARGPDSDSVEAVLRRAQALIDVDVDPPATTRA